ncbi:MAG: hypothetical protein M3O87_08440 [Candidatus Dormibacteraeota bacterium]|nr:hypothetical protein [Candidatus Dormibacteraeota bacterium]
MTEFHRNASKPGGLARLCKACQRAYLKDHYWRNRQAYIAKAHARNKAERAKLRKLLHELKGVPCADCGVGFPPWVMQFDHVRGVKVFEVGRGISATRVRMLQEAAKCEVVCANCHAQRTHERQVRARSSAD